MSSLWLGPKSFIRVVGRSRSPVTRRVPAKEENLHEHPTQFAFSNHGLVLNGGNATGTPGPVDQVEGSLICDAGQHDQTIFTTTPVPLNAQGNADFSGTFNTIPGTCTNPLFLIRIGPDLPGANQRWIATGAVRSFGDSH